MCVIMGKDTRRNKAPDPTNSNVVMINTPASGTGENTTSTPATPTPGIASPSPTINVTPVPGGKTSANPNYAGKKLIAITFDDGPHGTYTPKTLDILKEKGVHVTFFVQGVNLQSASQKAILKREFDEGHEIASHSYDHPDFKTLSSEQIAEQLQKTDNIVKEVTGQTPILFRPPYGRTINRFPSNLKKRSYYGASIPETGIISVQKVLKIMLLQTVFPKKQQKKN